MSEPTKISDEAREAQKRITPFTSGYQDAETIQLAISAATEKLTEENRKLKEEVERLAKFHTEDMRVTNESADFHIKQCFALQSQVQGLREALQRCLTLSRMRSEPYIPMEVRHDLEQIMDKALSSTTDFSKMFVKRQVLQKCYDVLLAIQAEHERLNYKWKPCDEALSLAKAELEK